jgi:hypothetical protein
MIARDPRTALDDRPTERVLARPPRMDLDFDDAGERPMNYRTNARSAPLELPAAPGLDWSDFPALGVLTFWALFFLGWGWR